MLRASQNLKAKARGSGSLLPALDWGERLVLSENTSKRVNNRSICITTSFPFCPRPLRLIAAMWGYKSL
jgi:hypothetical protein